MFLTSHQHLFVSCSPFHVVMFLQTTPAIQCRSFTKIVVAAMLSMILDAVIGVVACTSSSWSGALTCVASSLLLVAAVSSGILLATSSSHLAQTISGLLQRDFRHFQHLDVRKLLDSSLAHLLWFKQMSKMSTLGSTAFLVPVHNLLSPSITIFWDLSSERSLRTCPCPQWFRADLICLPAPSGIRCWTGPQSPPPKSLNSSLNCSHHHAAVLRRGSTRSQRCVTA